MLEYALEKERVKTQPSLVTITKESNINKDSPPDSSDDSNNNLKKKTEDITDNSAMPEMDLFFKKRNNEVLQHARTCIKQFLEEVGYVNTLIDLEEFDVRSALNFTKSQPFSLEQQNQTSNQNSFNNAFSVRDDSDFKEGNKEEEEDNLLSMMRNIKTKSNYEEDRKFREEDDAKADDDEVSKDDFSNENILCQFNETITDGSSAGQPKNEKFSLKKAKDLFSEHAKDMLSSSNGSHVVSNHIQTNHRDVRKSFGESSFLDLNDEESTSISQDEADLALAEYDFLSKDFITSTTTMSEQQQSFLPKNEKVSHDVADVMPCDFKSIRNNIMTCDQNSILNDISLSNVNVEANLRNTITPNKSEHFSSGVVDCNSFKWQPRATLRGHFDVIRAIIFHRTQPIVISASDDCLVKFWNASSLTIGSLCTEKNSKSQSSWPSNTSDVSSKILSLGTLRCHMCSVISLEIDEIGHLLFSGDVNGFIYITALSQLPQDLTLTSLEDLKILPKASMRIPNHQPVWNICHISHEMLVTNSPLTDPLVWSYCDKNHPHQDNTLIEIQEYKHALSVPIVSNQNSLQEILLMTGTSGEDDKAALSKSSYYSAHCVKCLANVPYEINSVVVAYSRNSPPLLNVFNAATGESLISIFTDDTNEMKFSQNDDEEEKKIQHSEIECITVHITLPICITGFSDNFIKFFDLNKGTCISSMISHLDAVSSVIPDPNGIDIISSSHDGSIRFWCSDSKECTQQLTSVHRKKFDESVLSLATFSSPNQAKFVLASSGADGLVKLFVKTSLLSPPSSSSPQKNSNSHPSINQIDS